MDYRAIPADELIQICARRREAAAWEEFIRRFNPVITRAVVRTARGWGESSTSGLDDLVQETYLKLCAEDCRLLRTFQSRQPDAIYGYLKVITTNLVHDHFKGSHAAKRGSGNITEDIDAEGVKVLTSPQRTLSTEASMQRDILFREIDHQLARLVPTQDLGRSRLIFWLYYRSGLSASAIASLPALGLTTKGVESTLLRLTRSIRDVLAERQSLKSENLEKSNQHRKGLGRPESF
jgi:RNA polymerase sigma-70 factor, ECF subfamily